MKKSFIISLVMVVILIASLATATYAWYTTQSVVSATETTIYTAETGATLVVSDTFIDSPTWSNNSVTLTMTGASAESGINPMLIDSAAALNHSGVYSDLAFLTTTLNNAKQANAAGTAGTPATLTAVTDGIGATGTLIYVANPGKADAEYGVKVTFANEDVTNGLRVAVYACAAITSAYADSSAQTTAVNAATLVGIWAQDGQNVGYMDAIAASTQFDTTSGLFTGEAVMTADDTGAIVFDSGSYSTNVQTLAAYDNTDITNIAYTVVAWFEGATTTNEFAGLSSGFTIEFNLAGAAD